MDVTARSTASSPAAAREIARLRQAIEDIWQACADEVVSNELPMFSESECLMSFCERILKHNPDQLDLIDLVNSVPGGSSRGAQGSEGVNQ